jgi:hypothetical protein
MDSEEPLNRLTIEDERKHKRELREAEMRRIVMAYKRVFSSEDGQMILNDLSAAFGWTLPVFLSTGVKPGVVSFDELYGAKRDGQQDIYRHITAKLAAPNFPDGNPAGPVEVLTGLSQ